eukprot:c22865_g1_i3 orf=614-2377(-)
MKREAKQWKLLDFVTATFFLAIFVFFVLVFTSLGDSLAASGRQSLALTITDSGSRERLLKLVEAGRLLEFCPRELVDHMPCEDPKRMVQFSKVRNYYRERHCPPADEKLLCLIPQPRDYRIPVPWPDSLHKIWYSNMPHNKIAQRKGHQGWMREQGSYFIFPGGGTMFTEGASKYIGKLEQYVPLRDGSIRTALDVGCGVASFGGFLLEKNVLTLSFAPRDSHKAQIQFALERGIPAFVAMLGTHRLPFPAHAFDLVHCSRCLISFTAYNGTYLMEIDRLLRPEGYFVLSGPPVQWSDQEKEWEELQDFMRKMCYEIEVVEGNTAIWKKPLNHLCQRDFQKLGFLICDEMDDPNAAWNVPLKECISHLPLPDKDGEGWQLPRWPERLNQSPRRMSEVQNGNGRILFEADTHRWQRRVKHYKEVLGLFKDPSHVHNVMDMNAAFGGFAAAIIADPVWVMNVVPTFGPNTLPVIYDRGLIGVMHDWCEAFSSYPRTYDLIHVVDISSLIQVRKNEKSRCTLVDVILEMDRILRPEGMVVIRDSPQVLDSISKIAGAIHWLSKTFNIEVEALGNEKLLLAKKQFLKLASS